MVHSAPPGGGVLPYYLIISAIMALRFRLLPLKMVMSQSALSVANDAGFSDELNFVSKQGYLPK